jgi:hypothetical protein
VTHPPSHRERLAADIRSWLRETFAAASTPVWTIGVEHEPAALDDAARQRDAYEQDTILGEFLRTVDALAQRLDEPLKLADFAAVAALGDDAIARLEPRAANDRLALMRRVSELGQELLGGERATSAACEPDDSPRRVLSAV